MEIASLTSSLAPLALLACPVSMGLMMWMMMRANRTRRTSGGKTSTEASSIEMLREEQRRLSEEIDRLEMLDSAASRSSPDRPR